MCCYCENTSPGFSLAVGRAGRQESSLQAIPEASGAVKTDSGFGEQWGVVSWSPCHEHGLHVPLRASDCAASRGEVLSMSEN